MDTCFKIAAAEYEFKGKNFIVYPIKVNQMRPVVEEIVSHGKNSILVLKPAQSLSFMQLLQSIPTMTRS
jgi:arginine decarboxylase-like protein